ncbi:tetratricopeptide repeat protein [Sphingomonas sp.]|uniref:tetratricopeptide repeat protein n=1 Tax=Sphingomonas sp. TaxID=28214 RepID=UPI00180627E9|nr:tetratricopeptide repeat protein [Sphingomonas sp.]MBA4761228.1 tetratricopeptide repeat protein [Sphingomonas sp.]
MIEHGRNWIGAGLIAVGMAVVAPAMAQETVRVPVPPEGIAAFERREYGKAADAIVPAFETCKATRPHGNACADLAMAVAVLVATAGNAKVEPTILDAQAYIDTRVGRDSPEALGILGALTTYYDRLMNLQKFLPAAERRLAVARKLNGPTARVSVIAAVSLCVAQWNLGRGEDALALLTPLAGKLPENTPDELVLSGRVHECTGTANYSLDRYREAEGAFRKAAALYERAGGGGSDLTLDAMASLASTLRRLDRESEARTVAARIISLAKPDAAVLKRIDWALAAPSDPIEAARADLASIEKQYGANSPVATAAAAQLGVALIDAGRFAEAAPYMDRLQAAANDEAIPAALRIKLLIGQVALTIKQESGRLDRVVPVIEQLVALAKRTGAGSDKLLIDFQMYAGTSLLLIGQPDRAYPLLSDAGALLLERLASYRDFDAAAQRETRQYSPIFKFKVASAWTLAQRR